MDLHEAQERIAQHARTRGGDLEGLVAAPTNLIVEGDELLLGQFDPDQVERHVSAQYNWGIPHDKGLLADRRVTRWGLASKMASTGIVDSLAALC